MKISKIRIMNWKKRNFEFSPEKLNYCFHQNGYGKTSILDALRYGLTGNLSGYEADGSAVEVVEGSRGLDIYRARSGTSTVCKTGGPQGKKVTEKVLNKVLSDVSGISVENLKLLSSGDIFSHMKPDDFLALLLEFIPEQLTYETVISYIDGFTDEMDDMLGLYLPCGEPFGIQVVDDCADALAEARRGMKANLSQNKQVLATLIPGETRRTLDEIESELIDIQVAERMAEKAEKKQKDYEILEARHKKQKKQIDDRKAWLEANEAEKPDPAVLAARKKERAEKDDTKKKLVMNQATAAAAVSNLEHSLKYLDLNTCVISKKLVCTTDKSGARIEVVQALEQNKKLLENYAGEIKACESRSAEIDKEIEGYYAAEKKYNIRQRVVNELKTLGESLVMAPEKPAAGQKRGLADRKKELMEEKEMVTSGIYRRKLEAMNQSLENDIAVYTALIDAFADKGPVKTGIINYYVHEFEQACNAHFAQAEGFEISFVPENGVRVYAKTPENQTPVYYTGLSSGEKIMVSFLILDMLNQLTGMRIAFIDNLEQLDRRSMEYAHDILTSDTFLDSYDHVFVCGVDNQDVMEVFSMDSAKFL